MRSKTLTVLVVTASLMFGACGGGPASPGDITAAVAAVKGSPTPAGQATGSPVPTPTPIPTPTPTLTVGNRVPWSQLPAISAAGKAGVEKMLAGANSFAGSTKRAKTGIVFVHVEGTDTIDAPKATDFWTTLSRDQYTFVFLPTAAGATVVVRLQPSPSGNCGGTVRGAAVRGIIPSAVIYVSTTQECRNVLTPWKTLTHELGHFLLFPGVEGHISGAGFVGGSFSPMITPLLEELVVWLLTVEPDTTPIEG